MKQLLHRLNHNPIVGSMINVPLVRMSRYDQRGFVLHGYLAWDCALQR
jgi:hypothetical protein